MQSITKILMDRDGMTYTEAKETVDNVRDMVADIMEQGFSGEDAYMQVAEILECELGLEPDFICEFV